jgi:hypothetical protein
VNHQIFWGMKIYYSGAWRDFNPSPLALDTQYFGRSTSYSNYSRGGVGQEMHVVGLRSWRRNLFVVVAAAALVGVGLSAFLLVDTGSSAPPLAIDGVDLAALRQQDIDLKAPPSDALAKVPSEDAAAKAGLNLPAKEVVLARLVSKGPPALDRLVWAVSYDGELPVGGGGPAPVAGEPAGVRFEPADYMLAFVDAETGEFLFSVQANRIQP